MADKRMNEFVPVTDGAYIYGEAANGSQMKIKKSDLLNGTFQIRGTVEVFLVDPPYLSTEVGTYKMYWCLADYLDVLNVLKRHSFVYFTSNKSSILELCDWMDRNPFIGNPFKDCRKIEFNAHMNYNSKYTDIMLYTTPKEGQSMIS